MGSCPGGGLGAMIGQSNCRTHFAARASRANETGNCAPSVAAQDAATRAESRCQSAAAEQLARTLLNAATPRPPVSEAQCTLRGQSDGRPAAGGRAPTQRPPVLGDYWWRIRAPARKQAVGDLSIMESSLIAATSVSLSAMRLASTTSGTGHYCRQVAAEQEGLVQSLG